MTIFLTGATGYIGSAVHEGLARAGHEVTALVRHRDRGALVRARRGRPVVGDLGDPASYRKAAEGHDGYVHTGLEGSPRGKDVDRQSIETLLDAARASGARVFIYTSGCWVLGPARSPASEEAPVNPAALVAWRPAHEQLVLDAARDGFRTIVVRPAIVYGGSRGIVGDMFRDAANGLMRVIGRGTNHWPLVYDRDLADLYVRLAASPDAAGIYHANDEADERVNDLVEAIARAAPVRPEIRYMPLKEARAKLGDYADALALDQVLRSPRARALGWTPSLHSVGGNVPRLFEEWRRGREAA